MSLEQNVQALTSAIEKNNSLLERLLAASPLTSGTEAPKTEGKKAEGKKADDKSEAAAKADTKKADAKKGGVDDVKAETLKKFLAWLGEFPADHPETQARQDALRQLLDKLGEDKISQITDAKKLGQLVAWLEDPAKGGKDRGFGPGRFAADPSDEDGDSSNDEFDV